MSTRTTLTLDDDVAARLMEAVRSSGRPMKVVVNDAIRAGLEELPRPRKRFVVHARPMGRRPGFETENMEELITMVEGPFHR